MPIKNGWTEKIEYLEKYEKMWKELYNFVLIMERRSVYDEMNRLQYKYFKGEK